MANSSDLNIDYVANLARLALTPEEKEKFSQQLGNVLHHIAQLTKVDVTGIEPTTYPYPVHNIWAEDIACPGLNAEQALRNAPTQRKSMISVPKVVE